MSLITEIARVYFQNLAKTIMHYLERHLDMEPAEILLSALAENGIDSVSILEKYIEMEILNYGRKVVDLKTRLNVAYSNLVNDKHDYEDIQFESQGEQIIS